MKHYIEIQRLRTQDVVVDDTLTLEKNTDAFIQGDIISITEKIDGANSSIYYDKKLDRLRCFSSKNELDFSNQLRGFLTYVESLDKEPFIKYSLFGKVFLLYINSFLYVFHYFYSFFHNGEFVLH